METSAKNFLIPNIYTEIIIFLHRGYIFFNITILFLTVFALQQTFAFVIKLLFTFQSNIIQLKASSNTKVFLSYYLHN